MDVSLSPRAVLDLEEIGDYIARDNPIRAVAFVEELRAVIARFGAYRAPTLYSRGSIPTSAAPFTGDISFSIGSIKAESWLYACCTARG
jgi:plasmid stabilization system protein ParE